MKNLNGYVKETIRLLEASPDKERAKAAIVDILDAPTMESKLYYVCAHLFNIHEVKKAKEIMKEYDVKDLHELFMKSVHKLAERCKVV